MVLLDIDMSIPTAVTATVKFDETHSALHKAPTHQTERAELLRVVLVDTIKFSCSFGFAREVHCFRRGGLHPVGELIRIQAGCQFGVFGFIRSEIAVESREKIEFAAL